MRRLAVLASALAALVLAACAQQSAVTVPAGPPIVGPSGDGPRAIAVRVVQRTLADAPLPSGARMATAAEAKGKHRVPEGATAVHVVRVAAARRVPQRVTLTGRAVHRLARELNRQRPISPGAYSCPNDTGASDVLHFTGATPDPVFKVEASGCGFITVATDGVSRATLRGGVAADKLLTAILARRR